MRVILLFDSDTIEGVYREYTLQDDLDEKLRKGKRISIKFCHPFFGEMMIAKVEQEKTKDGQEQE